MSFAGRFFSFLLVGIAGIALAEPRYQPPRPPPTPPGRTINSQPTPPPPPPARTFNSTPPPPALRPPPRRLSEEETGLPPQPARFEYSVGYEGAATSTSILGQNAIAFGTWITHNLGFEAYLGYTHNADSFAGTTTTAVNTLTNAQTQTTAYSGTKTPSSFILGGVLKYRVYQNNWFQFYAGGVLLFSPGRSSNYATGTRTETTPDTTNPGNRSVVETSFGSVDAATSAAFSIGPKLGTEFYLPWFPHLAIGFSTGILTTFGGNTKTTTNARSRTYNVVNGTDQTPSSDANTTTVADNDAGMRGTTFGIGGTNFQFNGIFTIRYCW